MRFKKNRRQESVEQYDTETRCDICKKEIRTGIYEKQDVSISATLGESYPEGDNATTYEMDCCGKCFLETVKPVLEGLGVVFIERDSDDYDAGYVEEPK